MKTIKFNKKILILFPIVLGLFVLSGCVKKVTEKKAGQKQEVVEEEQVNQEKEQIDQAKEEEILNENDPKRIVRKFYEWYVEEIDMCTGMNKKKDCNFDFKNGVVEKEFVTNNFYDNVLSDRDGHSNPIICAQDTPDRMDSNHYQASDLSQNKCATVMAHLIYSISGDNQIEVKLKLVDNQWKIDEIICPNR